jgi:hypothetical protein
MNSERMSTHSIIEIPDSSDYEEEELEVEPPQHLQTTEIARKKYSPPFPAVSFFRMDPQSEDKRQQPPRNKSSPIILSLLDDSDD